MRELVLKMSISIDGFVVGERPGSDWMFRGSTPDSAAWVYETLSGAGIHALGRRTFEGFVGYWPTSESPMAKPMNEIPKIVFTRQADFRPAALGADAAATPVTDSWTHARVASGDLATEIGLLKQETGGYILAQAGADFCRSLAAAGLVDEFRLAVLPVALGSGEGLFTSLRDELDLELVSSTAFTGGAMGNVYRPKR